MNKVLVEIYIPSISKVYDLYMPKKVKIYKFLEQLAKSISELSQESYMSSEFPILCHGNSGKPLDINLTLEDLNIMNGYKLILI